MGNLIHWSIVASYLIFIATIIVIEADRSNLRQTELNNAEITASIKVCEPNGGIKSITLTDKVVTCKNNLQGRIPAKLATVAESKTGQ